MTKNTEFYRMTIRLPIGDYAQLKAIAIRKGLTIQECARTAIAEYLTKEENALGFTGNL